MPLTPDMRRSIDQIRDYLYGGGYPDPVTNAEQLSFLFFFYLVEGIDAENLLKAKVLKTPYESMFAGDWTLKNPLNAPAPGQTTIPRERFRWSVWARGLTGEGLVRFLRDEVFAFFGELGEQAPHNFMNGARLTIDEPTVLAQVINLVDGLRLDQSDAGTKGDLFEHVEAFQNSSYATRSAGRRANYSIRPSLRPCDTTKYATERAYKNSWCAGCRGNRLCG